MSKFKLENKFIIAENQKGEFYIKCKVCKTSIICPTVEEAKLKIKIHMMEIKNGIHSYDFQN